MITGAHAILYSKNADADRDFLKKVLKFAHVDVGGGWLIFGLPPAEVAVHPASEESHELYLMTDDLKGFRAAMKKAGVATDEPSQQGWGVLTHVTLPGGGKLGVYEPRHATPHDKPRTKKAAPKKKASSPRRSR